MTFYGQFGCSIIIQSLVLTSTAIYKMYHFRTKMAHTCHIQIKST